MIGSLFQGSLRCFILGLGRVGSGVSATGKPTKCNQSTADRTDRNRGSNSPWNGLLSEWPVAYKLRDWPRAGIELASSLDQRPIESSFCWRLFASLRFACLFVSLCDARCGQRACWPEFNSFHSQFFILHSSPDRLALKMDPLRMDPLDRLAGPICLGCWPAWANTMSTQLHWCILSIHFRYGRQTANTQTKRLVNSKSSYVGKKTSPRGWRPRLNGHRITQANKTKSLTRKMEPGFELTLFNWQLANIVCWPAPFTDTNACYCYLLLLCFWHSEKHQAILFESVIGIGAPSSARPPPAPFTCTIGHWD